jgi:hypothetical protein
MREAQSLRLGDRVYAVSQLPAMQAYRLLPRIGKAVGPVLGKILAGGGLKDLLSQDLGPAVEKLFDNLTDDELEFLTRELLTGATVQYTENGKRKVVQLFGGDGDAFNLVMRGHIPDVFRVLYFAFRVNYGNFSGALPGAEGEGNAANEIPSP